MNRKNELNMMRLENGVFEKDVINDEKTKQYRDLVFSNKELPENINYDNYNDYFFKLKTNFTDKEISEYIGYKQIQLLSSIKKCLVFFVICFIIELLCRAIILLPTIS